MNLKPKTVHMNDKRRGAVSLAALVASLIVAGCGGGGTTGSPLTGKLLDGYIKGATVCLDLNKNTTCDAGEPSAVTGEGGEFKLFAKEGSSLAGEYLLAVVTAAAEDSDNPGQPAIPSKMLGFADQPGLITPLTTVVAGFVKAGSNHTQAEAKARTLLGLPSNFSFQSDYLANQNSGAHAAARVINKALSNVIGAGTMDDAKLKLAVSNASELAKQAYANPSQVASLIAQVDSRTQDVQPVYETLSSVNLKNFEGFEVMRSRYVPAYQGKVAAGYVIFSGQYGSGIVINNFATYAAQVNGAVKFKVDLYASQKTYGAFTGLAEFDLYWHDLNYSHGQIVNVKIPEDGKNQWKTYEIDTAAAGAGSWGNGGIWPNDTNLKIKTGKDNYAGPMVDVVVGKIQMSNDNWATSITITPDGAGTPPNWSFFAEGFDGTNYWNPYPEFMVVDSALTQRGDLIKMIKTSGAAPSYAGMAVSNFAPNYQGSSITMEVDVFQQSGSFPVGIKAEKADNYQVVSAVATLNPNSTDAAGNWKTYRFTLSGFDPAVHTKLVITPDPANAGGDQTMYISNLKVIDVVNPFK